jgi:4-amino-4-deoxy-L-arabinose transferase-like glycosyltransferase
MVAVAGNEKPMLEQLFVSRQNRWLVYLTLFLCALFVRIATYTGIICSDDLAYSYFAQLIAQGISTPEAEHFRLRVGVTVPVAIIYRIFGTSEWTTIVVPLFASALSVPLLVAIGRRIFPVPAAFLAGLLLMTFSMHANYATILIPEPIMEFYVLCGVFVYLKAREESDSLALAVLAGLCFGVAYLAKEAGIFPGAAFILYSMLRRQWKLALAIAAGMASVGALEVAYYFVQTGDALYRPHVIAHSQETYFAFFGESARAWRLLQAYPRMMIVPNLDFGFHSVIALTLAASSLFLIRGEKVWMLIVWAAVPMLYLNFGSSSLSNYQPVAVSDRYIGLVYQPLFLLAGAVLYHWLSMGSWMRNLARCLVVLLTFTGLATAVASGDTINFSAETRVLKAILQRAQANHLQIVRFEGYHAERWRMAMGLLSRRMLTVAECESGCLVITPDALKLPVATDVAGARSERALGSTPVYPFRNSGQAGGPVR